MEVKRRKNRANTSIQNLPEELKTKIFFQLPMKDIFPVCLVCKQWNNIIMSNESVWKSRCYNLPEILHTNIVNDRAHGLTWKETFKMNYGKNGIKRMWQQGLFSNPASYDDLPQGMFSNMDVDSWGDLFQQELDRS